MEYRIVGFLYLLFTLVDCQETVDYGLLEPNTLVLSPEDQSAALYDGNGEEDASLTVTVQGAGSETDPEQFSVSEAVPGNEIDIYVTQSPQPDFDLADLVNSLIPILYEAIVGPPQDFGYNCDVAKFGSTVTTPPAVQGFGAMSQPLKLDSYQLMDELEQYQKLEDFYMAPQFSNLATYTDPLSSVPHSQGLGITTDPYILHSAELLDQVEDYQRPTGSFDIATLLNSLLTGTSGVAIAPAIPTAYSAPPTYAWQQTYGAPSLLLGKLSGYPQVRGTGELANPPRPSTTSGGLQTYPGQQLYRAPFPPLITTMRSPLVDRFSAGFHSAVSTTGCQRRQ
ncbi:uncharacterized protein LOC124616146 [Schistocerca americana]|uniref:uncharacterized protein LOC124616146 n=1 Tax=Schistocerca americana TaxID=7009 RepID=UPI001F4F58EF|nr:uncharacterized protein LOC124616146 [Schistocerca americana]XP_047000377.1 uncharacterized protein LOC124616146 [Schistocerca americana]XP_047000378.1 uncharacterized protein LOC124616146 [Schistocerca americana]